MLQKLRDKTSGWIATLILGLLIIPFAFVEAAANLLSNPALDAFGKIPEFKFCAAKVEPVDPMTRVAAE